MREITVKEFITDRGFPEARGVPETGYIRIDPVKVKVIIPPRTYDGLITGHWGKDTICFQKDLATLRINGDIKILCEDNED